MFEYGWYDDDKIGKLYIRQFQPFFTNLGQVDAKEPAKKGPVVGDTTNNIKILWAQYSCATLSCYFKMQEEWKEMAVFILF